MNRHFKDAQYYLKRAGEHAKRGLAEELDPIEERFRELVGREKEPEPGRLEAIQSELLALERRAEGEARTAIADARGRIKDFIESRRTEEPVKPA